MTWQKEEIVVEQAKTDLGCDVKKDDLLGNFKVGHVAEQGLQGQEISSTSRIIQQNYCLYKQLTKPNLTPLDVPTSPVELQTIQNLWTQLPSPLPMPTGGEAPQHMSVRMKSLPSHGFKPSKIKPRSTTNVNLKRCGEKAPKGQKQINPEPLHCRRRRRTLKNENKDGFTQGSITKWVTPSQPAQPKQCVVDDYATILQPPDSGNSLNKGRQYSNTTGVGISKYSALTPLQQCQRNILIATYEIMKKENVRVQHIVKSILNEINRELLEQIECYNLLSKMKDSKGLENSPTLIQLFRKTFATKAEDDKSTGNKMDKKDPCIEKPASIDIKRATVPQDTIPAPQVLKTEPLQPNEGQQFGTADANKQHVESMPLQPNHEVHKTVEVNEQHVESMPLQANHEAEQFGTADNNDRRVELLSYNGQQFGTAESNEQHVESLSSSSTHEVQPLGVFYELQNSTSFVLMNSDTNNHFQFGDLDHLSSDTVFHFLGDFDLPINSEMTLSVPVIDT